MMLSLLLASVFTFVELNCENLFDCLHDTSKQDEEFMPDSYRHWTRTRYWRKLNHIGQEILSCGEDTSGWSLPDMVALCEVENDSVMHDLTMRSLLRKAGYRYIMTSSPDLRGIDVALMYSPFSFSLLNHHSIRVAPMKDMRPTRDILYASGVVLSGDTLHVFVVHAPSRAGGEAGTRPFRMLVARRLENGPVWIIFLQTKTLPTVLSSAAYTMRLSCLQTTKPMGVSSLSVLISARNTSKDLAIICPLWRVSVSGIADKKPSVGDKSFSYIL